VFTTDFAVVRALVSRGRTHEQAVQKVEPYESIQEPDEGARVAMSQVAARSRQWKRPAFLFVNNRLEGHAPTAIEKVVEILERVTSKPPG
jgi:hypothetical protein